METTVISNGDDIEMAVLYVDVPFDILPTIGFRYNLSIEGCSSVRHLQGFFASLPWCFVFGSLVGGNVGHVRTFMLFQSLLLSCRSLRASKVE